MRLEGKVAIVTGGARGVGAAEARLLACEGAKVAIGDVLEADGKAVEVEIAETGGQALFIPLDVTKEPDWSSALEQVVARFGKLDILVNNAGISSRAFPDPTDIDGCTFMMEINSKGVTWEPGPQYPPCSKPGAAR